MKRIDMMSLAVGGVILAAGIALSAYWADKFQPEPVIDTADWHTIAIRQHQRAEMYKRFAIAYELVYEHFDFDCWTEIGAVPAASSNVEPLEKTESSKTRKPRGNTSLKAAPGLQSNNRTDGELRYWAEQSAESDSDAVKLRRHPAAAERRIAPDSKGQPSDDEASIALYERLSDRAKEGRWYQPAIARTAAPSSSTSGISAASVSSPVINHLQRMPSRFEPIIKSTVTQTRKRVRGDKGKGEAWPASSNAIFAVKQIRPTAIPSTPTMTIRSDGQTETVATMISGKFSDITLSMMPAATAPTNFSDSTSSDQQPIPCRLPIAIGRDGKLLEPCDPTTGKPLSGFPMGGRANSIVAAESRREPSAKPEAPVVCPSDALGDVTKYNNAVSINWYRTSLRNGPGNRLPWLFQCHGEIAEKVRAAAAEIAVTNPHALDDLQNWMLTYLLDHGIYMESVNAWHHFTIARPADAVGVTDVVVQFNDGWLRPGEIDRDGMGGEVYADPDCSQCEVWFFAPMTPGTATVASWGKR